MPRVFIDRASADQGVRDQAFRASPHLESILPRSELSPRRRQLVALRYRDRDWRQAIDHLFDKDGRSFFYHLCLADEGVGTQEEAIAAFTARCRDLLGVMHEARPAEAPEVAARWDEWWGRWRATLKV